MEIPEEPGFLALVLGWGATIAMWFFRGGRKYEEHEATLRAHADALKGHDGRLDVIEGDYMTSKDQKHFQQHVDDVLALALEKRDREFDRKFSVICQGITEIKSELKK